MKIDGKEIAKSILLDLKKRVEDLKKKEITPHMLVILVGKNPASIAYIKQKRLKAEEIGAKFTLIELEKNVSNKELIELVKKLDCSKDISGIIVQRPLPEHINKDELAKAVCPEKDIDSFHPNPKFPMPLAAAILRILEEVYKKETKVAPFIDWLKSKTIVVIGKGESGGGPTIDMLRKMGIEPLIVDSKTQNRDEVIKKGDIVISAVGKSKIVHSNNIKKGVILIGVGMFKDKDDKLKTDYEEVEIEKKASFYTPVPGGVGPVNVAMLLENLITGASKYFSD